jgi:hypothetical protein
MGADQDVDLARRQRRSTASRVAPFSRPVRAPAARRPPRIGLQRWRNAGAPGFPSAPSARPAGLLRPHSAAPAARRWFCPRRHRPAAAAACALGDAMSFSISASAVSWPSVSAKGSAAIALARKPAHRLDPPPGRSAQLRPDQHQRQLVGQQARHRPAAAAPMFPATGRLHALAHAPPSAPRRTAQNASRLQERRVLPFRQHRHFLQRAAHRLGQRFGGQAFGEGIDRLMRGSAPSSSTT